MSDHHHHDDEHDHPHPHGNRPLTDPELRVKALEQVLTEKGLIDPLTVDALIETYETKVGPHNGARVVARAWVDREYKQRLLNNGTAAIAELGFSGIQGEDMWWSKILRRYTTSWSAPCARVIRGQPWGCRRPGTKRRLIARGSSATHAGSYKNLVSNSATTSKSGFGIAPPSCAIWCCRNALRAASV